MDVILSVVVLAAFVLLICFVGLLYIRNEKIREERRRLEQSEASKAGLNQMAMHTQYNGLNTRGRIN